MYKNSESRCIFTSNVKYCPYCKNTGYSLKPIDMEAYDKEYDRLDNLGTVAQYICHERACEVAGCTTVPCEHCDMGKEKS